MTRQGQAMMHFDLNGSRMSESGEHEVESMAGVGYGNVRDREAKISEFSGCGDSKWRIN